MNQELINETILREWKLSFKGQQYIENTSDAIKFIGHLVFLITNGKGGKKIDCLEWKRTIDYLEQKIPKTI